MDDKMKEAYSPIDSFKGPYRWLSNFYMRPITVSSGRTIQSVEHGYNACKTLNTPQQEDILAAPTAAEAKKLGRTCKLRSDWHQIKDRIMYKLNKMKFTQHQDLKQKLLDTGIRPLIEGNNWGDVYWGKVNGRGLNKFGEILMRIRTELRENPTE